MGSMANNATWAASEEGKSAAGEGAAAVAVTTGGGAAAGASPSPYEATACCNEEGIKASGDNPARRDRHRLRNFYLVGGWLLAAVALTALIGTELWRMKSGQGGAGVGGPGDGADFMEKTHLQANQLKPFESCCIVQSLYSKKREIDPHGKEEDQQQAQLLQMLTVSQQQQQLRGANGTTTGSPLSPPLKGGVYVVLEEGRDALLGEALSYLRDHFCAQYDTYPVLVLEAFNATDEQRAMLRAQAPTCHVDFLRLDAPASAPAGPQRNILLLQSLLMDVPSVLASRFDWVLHITDRTLLDSPVPFDPLAALAALNRDVGYVGVTMPPNGNGEVWMIARSMVQAEGLTSTAFHTAWEAPKSVDPRWVAYRTKVGLSPVYRNFITAVESALLATPSAFIADKLPPESIVFTAGALLSLHQESFFRYPSTLNLAWPPPDPTSTAAMGASPDEDGVSDLKVTRYGDFEMKASEAVDLQPLLDVRRKGWLGADVGTSFRFPPRGRKAGDKQQQLGEAQTASRGDDDGGEKTMWLFGDTFLGFSSRTRRLPEAFFLHNTVGFAPRWRSLPQVPDPHDITFHWNMSRKGCPTSIFVKTVLDNECATTESYYWPISGLGVQLHNDETNTTSSFLIVTAAHWTFLDPEDVMTDDGPDLFNNNTFTFKVLGTTIIVVDNPHDEPKDWAYRTRHIPGTNMDHNWYSAMSLADGKKQHEVGMATSATDMIYLFGFNGTNALAPPDEIAAQVVARVSVASLLDLSLDDMQVWTQPIAKTPGDGAAAGEPSWVPYKQFVSDKRSAVKIATPSFSETSVRYSPYLDKWYSIQVDWMSTSVLLYLADDVTGPWEPLAIYSIPLPYSNLDYFFCYAGKSHPELTRSDDEIIITYVSNSYGDINTLFAKGAKGIYVPRFVRIQLSKVASPTAFITIKEQPDNQQEVDRVGSPSPSGIAD